MIMSNNDISAKFVFEKNGITKTVDLPILKATIGEDAFDVSKVAKECGLFAFDPGYMATASCKSTITYIDGNAGILMHRGYDIAYLVANKSYLEVAYLLIFDKFPTVDELALFQSKVIDSMQIAIDKIADVLSGFDKNSHPMGMLIAATARLAVDCDKDYNIADKNKKMEQINEHAILAIGKIAALVASINRFSNGKKLINARKDLDFSENFLYLSFAEDGDINYKPSQNITNAMDKLFILHADHEQNASTSAVRAVGSTGVNMFASIIGGISALWGPLHGGANEEVIKMIAEIGSVENIDNYIKKAETGEVKLMGFGHRIYKNNDPRATVIKEYCDKVLLENKNEKIANMLKIAQTIEAKALQEEYFIKRKLFPNVDFYSGIIYSAIGIPASMFTPIFAVARTSGWVSQWKEMLLSDDFKISRPRQLYIGDITH